jgi:hypothetical protein
VSGFSLVLLGTLAAQATEAVDFVRDIKPVLARHCLKCHGGAKRKGGLSIDTRQSLLAGGDTGPAAVVGKSGESLLIELVSGRDEARIMPAEGDRLSTDQIKLLAAWIDEGLAWPTGFSFATVKRASLAPRRPELPPDDAAASNPIDRLLRPYFAMHRFDPPPLVDDGVFARRVYLDLVGLLPTPSQVADFASDPAADKRARLVGRLLDDREAYATHWLTFWNDALRNAYRGTGFIDGGRQQITGWLYRSLYENKPYDKFVHELLSPVGGSEGFTKGLVWRGVVNSSQTPPMQAAQNLSQVFLGTNLKCASCHDSFVNYWKLSDAYSLAAVFADQPIEIHRCDKPTGEIARPAFIFPELGKIDGDAPRGERMRQLADLVTGPANGRLPRTIVNRLWAWFFGRGLVEPLDDMDQDPWHADLLDWLAVDLVEHDYDLKHTMQLIAASRAYQLPSVGAAKPDDRSFTFRGPVVRRMTAEQYADAIGRVLRVSREAGADAFSIDGRGQGGQLAAVARVLRADARAGAIAKWIWNDKNAAHAVPGGGVYLRKTFDLPAQPLHAAAVVTCDNQFTLWVNGRQVAASKEWNQPRSVDLTKNLVAGRNVIAAHAINWPDAATKSGLEVRGPNPAGFILHAAIQIDPQHTIELPSDASWLWNLTAPADWQQPDFDTPGWQHAVEVADAGAAPWGIADKLLATPLGPITSVRSALLADDALVRALGRPNREQVVTRRESIATTLQALELTNGQTLHDLVEHGARQWLNESPNEPAALVVGIYRTALGRAPTKRESAIAAELLGSPVTPAGLEDFLWTITMLPEFQLIH